MPVQHDNLFDQIASFPALYAASAKAIRGKRRKPGAAAFMANLERELLRICRELRDGSWRPGRYTVIDVQDPKPRRVSAAPFRDRVVHHALCSVIAPIFEHGFIHDSYANRAGKGSHAAIAKYERFRDRHAHVLRADIYRYLPAIDHAALKQSYRRRIARPRTLCLMDAIVDGSNEQEPVEVFFPGDGLFSVATRRRGLPIGNLTSQFFSNVYLDGFDHFVKEMLRAPYVRYVDDFALFDDDASRLAHWQARIATYLTGRRLLLHPRKTQIVPSSAPSTFLGLELHAGGWRRLPPENVDRFAHRLRAMRTQWRQGKIDAADVRARVQGWAAHAAHAHTLGLRHTLFRDGWFDPLWKSGEAVIA
ncbi:MAG: reverse transcriptase domain-containing protein [Pseudomonadota bacterium]